MVLALCAGCGDDSAPGRGERGWLWSALEPDFADVVPLCPETDDWGAWEQTPLSTWDDDVQPVVQWIIDQTGISCSTYSGHSPSIGRAADWRPHSRDEGTKLANWLQDHVTGEAAPLGLYYVMWQAQIGFSDEIRDVEDRGSFTANHCDHVHMSFYDTVDFRPDDVTPWDAEVEPDAGPPDDADVPTDADAPDDSDAPTDADTSTDGDAPSDTDAPDDGPTDADPDDAGDEQPDAGGAGFRAGGLVGGCAVSARRGRAPAWAGSLLLLLPGGTR